MTNFIYGDKRAGGLLHLMIRELGIWTGTKPESEVRTERNRNEKWGLNETGKAGENKSVKTDYL
jgi:hypothetical protein